MAYVRWENLTTQQKRDVHSTRKKWPPGDFKLFEYWIIHDEKGEAVPRYLDEDVLRAHLKEMCEVFGGQSAWAAKHGVSAQYVSDVLKGRRTISEKLADKLGCVRVVKYVRKDGL
jgi:hypothetical protein